MYSLRNSIVKLGIFRVWLYRNNVVIWGNEKEKYRVGGGVQFPQRAARENGGARMEASRTPWIIQCCVGSGRWCTSRPRIGVVSVFV